MRQLWVLGLLLFLGCEDETATPEACVDAPCPRLTDTPYVRAGEADTERFWLATDRNCLAIRHDPDADPQVGREAVRRLLPLALEPWNLAAQSCAAALCIRDEGDAPSGVDLHSPSADFESLLTFVDNPVIWDTLSDGESGRLAVTENHFESNTGRLLFGLIAVNQVDFTFVTGSPGPGDNDLLSVLTHEAGHLIGFDHVDEDVRSIMKANLNSGDTRRRLTAVDITGVCETFARP